MLISQCGRSSSRGITAGSLSISTQVICTKISSLLHCQRSSSSLENSLNILGISSTQTSRCIQHLFGRTPGRRSAYPKVTVHKTTLVHASHHTGHEWVERRKRKRIVLEELVELQPDLKFIKPDGSVDGNEWRKWKLDHRVSSATYNMLLYLSGNQYFSKRLTNEGKLKRASEFQEKFPDVHLPQLP